MKIFRFGLVLSLLVLLMSSCSSDDDQTVVGDTIGSGYLIYRGIEYPIKAGLIDNYGEDWSIDGSTEYEIRLMSSELIIASNGRATPMDNVYNIFDLRIVSKDDSKPKTGHYSSRVDYTEDFYFTGLYGYFDVSYDLDVDDDDYYIPDDYSPQLDLRKGHIDILQSGSIYEFEFELNDGMITGYYKGELLTDTYSY